ncbi:MAG: hypothetical protein LQ350_003513 [Teloschistes chrysophthalmus]|nr:MAG: hypothetical protein LQ350_003513 [Niorma chrysophthalma]
MARIQIPLDALTSRLNLGSRLEGVRSQSISTRFANLRPISEFLNLSRLSKPAGFGEVQSRVNYNLAYFSSNYVAVAIMLLIYSLLTNLTLLFDIVFVGLGLFAIKKLDGRDLDLGFARATTSQLYTGLFVIAVPLFIWANPIGSALWLVGATGSRRKHDYDDDTRLSEDEVAMDDRSTNTLQVALRKKEDLLLEQALERIRRAQMMGKQNVKLSKPELRALEQKRKTDEFKRARPTQGSTQADRRRSSGQLKATAKDSKPVKRKSVGIGPPSERTQDMDRRTSTPPGIIVPGPDGRPMHAPIGYYPFSSNVASSNRDSRSGSRSGSSANLQHSSPPLPSDQYWSPQPRYSQHADYAPPSPRSRNSPVLRRLPDDPNWNPRPRSSSSNQPYPPDSYYHQPYPSYPNLTPSQYSQGRRIVSGPAELRGPLHRRPPPLPSNYAASSDPALPHRTHAGEHYKDHNLSAEETDDDEDDGVQVDVRSDEFGYEIRTGNEIRSDIRPRKPPR